MRISDWSSDVCSSDLIVPGLALFYGGLVRTKNMLSVLTQVVAVAALAMLVWVFWGYTMAFGDGGNAYIAGFGKLFLAGVTPDSEIGRASCRERVCQYG